MSAPCQHMGSRYPWRVINPTNCSHALILGFSLLWKCSLNCAKGSALTLLAQAWLCSRRGRSRKAHPACPVSLSAPLDTHTGRDFVPQPGQTLSLGSSEEGAEVRPEGRRSLAGEQMVQSPWRLAALVPRAGSQGHFHNCGSACAHGAWPRPGHFLTLGYLISQRFWFSYCCLVYVTVHYFRNGCQLSKEAVGEFRLMGNLSVQTKSQSSHRTVQTFSQLCYITHRVWATLDHFTAQLLIFL